MSTDNPNDMDKELEQDLAGWKPPAGPEKNESNEELRAQLKSKLAQTGNISAGDVAGVGSAEGADAAEKFHEARSQESDIKSDEPVDEETGSYDAPNSKTFSAATRLMRQMQEIPDYLRDLFDPDLPMAVTVSPEDKENFFTAVVENQRFTKSYRLMAGKIRITFRTRTEQELRAYWSQYAHEAREAQMTTYEYRSRGRDLALAMAVESYQDTTFDTIPPKDLTPKTEKDGDGKFQRIDPPWVEKADYWAQLHPGLLQIIFKKFRQFEFLYWRLTAEADIENF